MPKRVAEVGEGNEDNHGVYGFIRDLIVEGKDARFVNKRGRYVISWSKALDRYVDFKSKKNPQFKCKKFNRRKASNGLRAALLNFYKKEGAREYKESKKVNDKDEVVERQFQMPPRVFESLFKNVKLADDSEPDEQDTGSIKSEGESEAQSPSHSSTSDAGFDETMDVTIEGTSGIEADIDDSTILDNIPSNPSLNVVKTEEDGDVFLPDTIQQSEMFDTSAVDSALEEICSDRISDDISDDLDLLGVVQDICPMSGSVKGGYQFYISLTEQLPDDITTGIVQFEGVANVEAQKLNPYTLSGIVPPSHQTGDVPVRVLTAAGQCLGMTCFRYIDEMREMMRQMVKDPTLQSLWFAMWSQEHGFFGADIDISQVLGPVNLPNQDSSSQTKQQQSVKILQLLVYTAAETDARQFIDMIFSTSAGKIIFNSYKDKTPLPEDIARANGHEDLARYLQDLNIRLSKEADTEAQSKAIDWSELVKAVQTQASVSEEEPSSRQKCPSESDDKSSDYFADAEMSSCGSFDLDEANQSDSEDKDSRDEDATSKEEPNKRPATSMKEPTNEIPDTKEKLSDNKVDKGSPRWWHSYSLSGWLSKWQKSKSTSPMPPSISSNMKDETDSSTFRRFPGVTPGLFDERSTSGQANGHTTGKPRTAKPKDVTKKRSPKRAATGLKYKGFLLAFAMVTVLAGLKLGEGYVLHWAVGNGCTRISKLLLHCGVYVDAPGLFEETPLHLAAKHGFKDLVDILVQNGGNINAMNFPCEETPLHLAVRYGHQHIAESIIQHGSDVNAGDINQETPLHFATRYGHQHIAESLIQHGSDVNARDINQETPLHFAALYGDQHIAESLIQHGSDVNARNIDQETPLHFAALHGRQHIAESLIQHGSDVNARSKRFKNTPLHLAAGNGHKQVVDILLRHGSDVNARSKPFKNTPLHLAARNGHKQVVDILLRQGSDVNARNDPMQETPLHLAARNGHQYVAEILVQHGSEVNAQNAPCIDFPRDKIFFVPLGYGHGTPLHLAARNGHKQVVDILLRHGSDANARDINQETPLHLATRNGHKQVVDILLRHRSDANARDINQETPLHFAARYGHQHVAESLIQHGSDVNARSKPLKNTPFHLAAGNGHKQVVDILLQHGSDANGRNVPWQETLLHLAAQNGHQHIVECLMQHGGQINAQNDMWQETFHFMTVTFYDGQKTLISSVSQKRWKTMLLHATWSPDQNNVYNCTGGIFALDLCQTGVLISSKRNRFETWTSEEKGTWENSTGEGHLQMIVLPCRNKTVDMTFEIEVYHRTQSAHQKNTSYSGDSLHDVHPCEAGSSHELEVKNETNGLLVDNVVFLTVSSSSDQCQQHRVANSTDRCQQQSRVESSDQSHKDSTLNSSDHYKQTRIKMGKLMRMVGGILVVCLIVACLLWYKYRFTVLTTNGSTEPHVSPCPEPLLGPGMDIFHTVVDLANTSNTTEEYLQGLSIVDIPMEKASIKKLQLERVRSWLNRNLETEVSLSSNFRQEMIMSSDLEIKAGVPSGQELYNLSVEVGATWKKLGHALQIPNAVLEKIDKDECKTSEKCFKLLLLWKQRNGKLATYTALEAGLHAVERSDLAKMFCYSSDSVRLLRVCEG